MHLFNELVIQNRPLIGTIMTLSAPSVVEVVSRCGFDWLWIDMEHAPLELDQVQSMLMAKTSRCAAFVRIPGNDEIWIKRVLDLGADGIIVPQVRTQAEAVKAVVAAKYPPLGTRSVGLARAQGFGMEFSNYVRDANSETTVILQIEHADGVQNIDTILRVEGIDAIIIGPYDLSGSYGKLGEVDDPQIVAAMKTVLDACKRHGVPIGIFALTPEKGKAYLKQGFQLLALGVDMHFLWTSAKASFESVVAAIYAEGHQNG